MCSIEGVEVKDGIENVRPAFQWAVSAVGRYVTQGDIIWEVYREFNDTFLGTLQRNMADVSPFTLEKRIVTSTWVHERKNTGDTLDTITVKFRERLNKDPQTCQTGIANCLKLATLRMHLVQEDQLNVESCAGLE
ncbi:uncharacterized protein LOC143239598 isoform X1 [Tachypleus tridentatus]|uniref:uncharacterized protein LOC143239598 isoform X1 n=1 Tax=Tachypleus tridentatus TaxID=6853 RepID=UPI003FD0F231